MTSTATTVPLLHGRYTVDPAVSAVRFSVAHFRIQTVRGTLGGVDGTVVVEDGRIVARGTADAASVRTGTAPRDAHLRSYLFDTAEHPTFAMVVDAPLAPQVAATVTVRGRAVPVAVRLESQDGGRLRASFTLDRRAAGLTWPSPVEAGGLAVGREVRVELDLALRLA